MVRWFITIFIAVIVFSAALPWLEKFGIGRLPGDLRFASTVLLSTAIFLLARLF
jgi:hypothetical protein